MVTAIVTFFILGYLCIALESVLKINKAVPALLMCVVCWTLYAIGGSDPGVDTSSRLLHHLGETCEILPDGSDDHRGNRRRQRRILLRA